MAGIDELDWQGGGASIGWSDLALAVSRLRYVSEELNANGLKPLVARLCRRHPARARQFDWAAGELRLATATSSAPSCKAPVR